MLSWKVEPAPASAPEAHPVFELCADAVAPLSLPQPASTAAEAHSSATPAARAGTRPCCLSDTCDFSSRSLCGFDNSLASDEVGDSARNRDRVIRGALVIATAQDH